MASSALVEPKTTTTPTPKTDGSGASYAERRGQQIEQAVASPPPPIAFQGIRVGPEMSIEYESNLTLGTGMDQSLLRKLSPFIIQVEPPLVFGQDGGFTQQRKSTNIGVYGIAGTRQTGPYQSARDRLSKTAFVNMDYRVSSGEEFYAKNQPSTTSSKSSNDSPTDSTGQSSSRLGPPAIADVYAALDIATQLSAVLNAPPLVLLLNPENMAMSYTKVQQFQDRTRFGYVYQSWGEEQPRLSLTARCGAFMTGGRGVQFASKRDSKAWQNLMGAFHLYKSNGYIYDTVGGSNANHFVGSLSIHYDQWIYYGHMESFNYTYDETHPNGGIEFSMEFVVSLMTDTSQPSFAVRPMRSPTPSLSDPRYQGMKNSSQNVPGEFSVGVDGDGFFLTTQGRRVSAEDALLTMVPQDAAQVILQDPNFKTPSASEVGKQSGTKTQPVGFNGFQTVAAPTSKVVTQASAGDVRPFRR